MTRPAPDLARLDRLHRWLTLESWAGTAGLAGLWLPVGPLALVLGVAAVAFTPVLVGSLWALGRRGWLAAFVVWVGGAWAGTSALGAFAGLAPLAALFAFYAYTWVLKVVVGEWLREAQEAAEWRRTKARWRADAGDDLGAAW